MFRNGAEHFRILDQKIKVQGLGGIEMLCVGGAMQCLMSCVKFRADSD